MLLCYSIEFIATKISAYAFVVGILIVGINDVTVIIVIVSIVVVIVVGVSGVMIIVVVSVGFASVGCYDYCCCEDCNHSH